jgi:hypothetical protein
VPPPTPTTRLLPVRATQLHIRLRFRCKTIQNHVSPFNYAGRRRGRGNDVRSTHQRQQPSCDASSISIYCFTWSRRLLQLEPSSPSSTSILVANFIPRHQLQPSPPSTSTLIAFNFNPRHLSISQTLPLSIPPSPWWPWCAWCSCYQMILSPRSSSTPSRMSPSFIF